MSNAYTQNNRAARLELTALIERLSNEQLALPLDAGWTVAGVLAHLAFWDQRALTLLARWQAGGIGPSPIDVDVINEATRPLCIAIEPHRAAVLTVAAAEAIDQAIEQLPPAFMAQVERDGPTVHLDRAAHRREHLRHIAQSLGL